MSIIHTSGPFAHGLIDSIFEDSGTALHRMHSGAQKFHAIDIEPLTFAVDRAHKDFTFHTKESRGGRRCHTVLSGARLGDDAGLPHFFRQQDLAKYIVDLVGSCVIEVFTLDKYLRPSQIFCHFFGVIQQRGTSRVMIQKRGQLPDKCRIVFVILIRLLQADQFIHQGFGDILSAKVSKSSFFHFPASYCFLCSFTVLQPQERLPFLPDLSIRPSLLCC